MLNDPLAWIPSELETLQTLGLRRTLAAHDGPQGATLRADGEELLNFGSNDYLALAADRRLGEAAAAAVAEFGWGSGASPLITGRTRLHADLETRLAELEGTEAALVFSSGYAANVGAIAALAARGDMIFSDAKNHASIIDGCRLSGARVQVFPHRDVAYLEKMLSQAGNFRRRLIVTDTLFSMDGDLAPLPELSELAARYDAMLMVDEAHATGVFGAGGRGVCQHFDVERGVQIRVGTLSKALGSVGGFVAGSRALVDWLANRARSYVFSTALPAAACGASLAALEIAVHEPARRQTLLASAQRLRDALRADGWNLGDSASQIVPVIIGTSELSMRLSARLREQGMWVPGIRPPSVPEGESLLRISLSYEHSQEMIDRLLDALRQLRSALPR